MGPMPCPCVLHQLSFPYRVVACLRAEFVWRNRGRRFRCSTLHSVSHLFQCCAICTSDSIAPGVRGVCLAFSTMKVSSLTAVNMYAVFESFLYCTWNVFLVELDDLKQ